MSKPIRELQYACGCVSAWNDLEGQYTRVRRCGDHIVRKEHLRLRLALQQSHDERQRRERAPLYYKPFSLLR